MFACVSVNIRAKQACILMCNFLSQDRAATPKPFIWISALVVYIIYCFYCIITNCTQPWQGSWLFVLVGNHANIKQHGFDMLHNIPNMINRSDKCSINKSEKGLWKGNILGFIFICVKNEYFSSVMALRSLCQLNLILYVTHIQLLHQAFLSLRGLGAHIARSDVELSAHMSYKAKRLCFAVLQNLR